ncbi:MAG: STAS domain-containing protein [Mogibacterium sp.]|nr:STAS domain-containing protein [Mogibacterium sp.]
MTIEKTRNDGDFLVKVSGRLDTTTAPELERELEDGLQGVTKLTIDFSDLEYISSAGLRVLLRAQRMMNNQGEMIVRGVNDIVKEIFEVTGFTDILTIE